MVKKVCVSAAAVVLASIVSAATSSGDLADGDVILHLPFDGDLLSVTNAAANPQSVKTFAGDRLSFVTEDLAGTNLICRGPVRENRGALYLDKAVAFLDITDFGFDSQLAGATIEFYIKGTAAGFESPKDWPQLAGIVESSEDAITKNTYATGAPFTFLLQVNPQTDPMSVHCRMDSNTGSSWPANAKVFDGAWHHVTMEIAPLLSAEAVVTGSVFSVYLDNVKINNVGNGRPDGFLWTGRTPADGKRVYLRFGHEQASFYLDEFRIAKGVLPQSRRIKLRNALPPGDKETLLYLPFDDGYGTLAHAEDAPRVISGEGNMTYGGNVAKPRVSTFGDAGVTVRKLNAGCLTQNGKTVLALPYWGLNRWSLDSATIEFFIKCDAGKTPSKWGAPVRITASDVPFPYLLQLNGSCQYFLRADGYEPVQATDKRFEQIWAETGVDFADGAWHHVAMTVRPNEDGTSTIAHYFDYRKLKELSSAPFGWRGLDDKMNLEFGNGVGCRFYLDELRITKGVLPVDDFLKLRPDFSPVIIVR